MCFEKGRSSSIALNNLCRKACAYTLGLRLQWRIRHVRTQHNVADEPSRRFDPPTTQLKKQKQLDVAPLGRHVSALSSEQGVPRLVGRASKLRGGEVLAEFGFIEIFAGSGGLTKACSQRGLRVFPGIDICNGPLHDVSRKTTQQYLIGLICSGFIWCVHLGTPCTIWSRARHAIKQHEIARAKEQLGIRFALFSSILIRKLLDRNKYFTLENPWGSLLWRFEPIAHATSQRFSSLPCDFRCLLFWISAQKAHGHSHEYPPPFFVGFTMQW